MDGQNKVRRESRILSEGENPRKDMNGGGARHVMSNRALARVWETNSRITRNISEKVRLNWRKPCLTAGRVQTCGSLLSSHEEAPLPLPVPARLHHPKLGSLQNKALCFKGNDSSSRYQAYTAM